MESYRRHLLELMGMWTRCRRKREAQLEAQRKDTGAGGKRGIGRVSSRVHPFRAIFKLSTAPNPSTEMKSCVADWGYNTVGYYLQVGNQMVREVVEAHGFEVFDPFPATAASLPKWFDLGGKDSLHADVLTDLTVQMMLNQICDDADIDPGQRHTPNT